MKIAVKLDKRVRTKDNKYPVKYYFYNAGKQIYVSTGLYALESEFDKDGFFLLKNIKTRDENRRNNIVLTREIERANMLYYDLKVKGKGNISPDRFCELLFANEKKQSITFNLFYEEFIDRKTGRTKELYEHTYNIIKKIFKKELYFEDIDYRFLIEFETNCRKRGNKVNTISIHLRNIRAVYNEAMKLKVVSKDLYPFDDYKVKNEETEHRALSVDNLRKIFAYEGSEAENYARDCAKLMFCLIGINTTDLYDLDYAVDGYINYRRDKTGRLYSIKIEDEMIELFDRFKGKESFLCFKEQFRDSHELTKKINGGKWKVKKNNAADKKEKQYEGIKRGLISIGEALGLGKITAYYMRHTWATIAGELDIPKETIAQALGHGRKDVTDIYIKYNRQKTDEANRKVLDYVFKNKRPEHVPAGIIGMERE